MNWYSEAAKKAGTLIAAAIVAVTVATDVVISVADLVPGKYQVRVQAAVAVLGAIAVALTRVQAVVTRSRVWSQESVTNQQVELLGLGRRLDLEGDVVTIAEPDVAEDVEKNHPKRPEDRFGHPARKV